jgi:2-oxo-3-hexenedioate decarboxylase
LLARRGEGLEAGSLILTGGVTEAVACQAGDHVSLRMQDLGAVSARFV